MSHDPQQPDADGHLWHSPAYVARWIEEHGPAGTTGPEATGKVHLDRIVAVLGDEGVVPRAVLDVGAGFGLLSARMLEAFPEAELVAQDFSAPMLEAAAERLAAFGSRANFLETDLEVAGSIAAAGRRFDAIVSSRALHHLRTDRLGDLYAEMHAAMEPGGVFVNFDRVHRRAADWVVAVERALYGGEVPGASVRPRRLARVRSLLRIRDEAATHGATLSRHLDLLAGAGFAARAIAMPRGVLMVGRA